MKPFYLFLFTLSGSVLASNHFGHFQPSQYAQNLPQVVRRARDQPTPPPPAPRTYPQPQPSYPQPSYPQPSYDGPVSYNFDWAVKDDYTKNDYGQQETRENYDTSGSYYVLLPDGRRQVVTYSVNGDGGYQAEVTYEGEAQPYQPAAAPKYPQPAPQYPKPAPRYPQPAPKRYEPRYEPLASDSSVAESVQSYQKVVTTPAPAPEPSTYAPAPVTTTAAPAYPSTSPKPTPGPVYIKQAAPSTPIPYRPYQPSSSSSSSSSSSNSGSIRRYSYKTLEDPPAPAADAKVDIRSGELEGIEDEQRDQRSPKIYYKYF